MRTSVKSFRRSLKSPSFSIYEIGVYSILVMASLVSVLTTVGIVLVLLSEVIHFFKSIGLVEFLTGTRWAPLIEPRSFGVLPLVWGTLIVGLGATFIAVPISVAAALYLSEYLTGRTKNFLKAAVEMLAGVPTVVYGFFALTFITPALRTVFPDVEIFNALSAILVVAIMIIPTICSVSQDAFHAVPRELREGAYGLGARKYQVALGVVFPAAFSGFIASVILGFTRAIGETMAVTLAAGSTPRLTWNLFESIQTMTAYIVQVSLGDTPAGSVEYESIFAVGAVLFLMTLVSNLIARVLVYRFQEKYE